MGYELRPGFAAALRQEVEAILDDPIFRRAPVQSQLLQLLCARTLDGDARNLSQYAIAIDGLNKPPSFDPIAHSNVRVQVSRLRAALERHYGLFQPTAGLCVYMKLGSYQLHLGRVDTAYPQIQSDGCKVLSAAKQKATSNNPYLEHLRLAFAIIAVVSGIIFSAAVSQLWSYFS